MPMQHCIGQIRLAGVRKRVVPKNRAMEVFCSPDPTLAVHRQSICALWVASPRQQLVPPLLVRQAWLKYRQLCCVSVHRAICTATAKWQRGRVGASRISHIPGVRTLPFAAAKRITGRLSPNTPTFLTLPSVYAASASPARSPIASAAMLELRLGTEAVSWARYCRIPLWSACPHIAAPAPTARGPSSGSVALGDLCRAPPSKETM